MKYEDLLVDPERILVDLGNFLSLDVSTQQIQEVLCTYDSVDAYQRQILHFNKGVAGRFEDVMTRKQLDLCNELFEGYLERMKYSVV